MATGDLVTKDWEVEYNGLALGGDSAFALTQATGFIEIPDLSTGDASLLLRHGLRPGDDFLRGRTVTMTFEIHDDSTATAFSERMDELAAATAPAGDELPLVFQFPGIAGGTKARLNCRPRRRSGNIGRDWYYGIPVVVVEFFATDPLIYDNTATETTLYLPDVDEGLTFDATFDLLFGSVGEEAAVDITNSGGFDAEPTIRINGPVVNPRLINLTTNEEWSWSGTLGDTDYLDVDMRARTVTLNGTGNRYADVNSGSTFWSLAPGINSIQFRGNAYTSATAVVTHRSAWA